jgi:uncharacterized protein YecE (DUF72 family)
LSDRPSATIRVGVAGWDYPDWNGIVYPTRSPRRLDRLRWISRFVSVLEINSTFYRPARPRVAEGWVHRTEGPDPILFTAKAHRSWTHEPGVPDPGTVAATLDGLRPLKDAGRLGALLVQFPQSFHAGPGARDRLSRLAERLRDWPVVVEVRHASWGGVEESEWFSETGLGWCVVDQPRVGRATLGSEPRVTGTIGYLRLHGRNAENWFRPDAGRDARYDYLYGSAEVERTAGTAKELASRAERVFVVQNNHFRGQALVNALQLRRILEGRRPAAPEELVAVYPQLEESVSVERRGLF